MTQYVVSLKDVSTVAGLRAAAAGGGGGDDDAAADGGGGGALLWSVSGELDVPSTLRLTDARARFGRQHHATRAASNGDLLLFDNAPPSLEDEGGGDGSEGAKCGIAACKGCDPIPG